MSLSHNDYVKYINLPEFPYPRTTRKNSEIKYIQKHAITKNRLFQKFGKYSFNEILETKSIGENVRENKICFCSFLFTNLFNYRYIFCFPPRT